jgi:hypothetical protein
MMSWVRRLRRVGIAAAVLLGAAQLIPVNRGNPPVIASASIVAREKLPPEVQSVFQHSCANCHSNRTEWPWYSYVAPASWVIAHDVQAGRRKINFSEWGRYSPEKREQKLDEICEQLTNGDMPDAKYLWLHQSAKPTQEQREAVCQWIENSRQY